MKHFSTLEHAVWLPYKFAVGPVFYKFFEGLKKKKSLAHKYLKPAIAGDIVAAVAATEPDTGSDVAAIKTRAKREGNYYIINGSKTFITNGTQADFVTTLVRTSDQPGYHSFSLIVVPTDLPGFIVGKKLDKIGMHSSFSMNVFYL